MSEQGACELLSAEEAQRHVANARALFAMVLAVRPPADGWALRLSPSAAPRARAICLPARARATRSAPLDPARARRVGRVAFAKVRISVRGTKPLCDVQRPSTCSILAFNRGGP